MKALINFFDGSSKHHYKIGDDYPAMKDGKALADSRKAEFLKLNFIGDGEVSESKAPPKAEMKKEAAYEMPAPKPKAKSKN